jgi:hypothetical protein
MYVLAKYFNIGAFRLARITSFLNPWADSQDTRMANNTKSLCNRFRRTFWFRTSEKAGKNIRTYQNHKMTLFSQF